MDQDEFKKIISQAISQEVEAFTFYSTVSDKAKDVNLKRLFKGLAEEEAKHKRTLEGFLTKDPGKMHFSVSPDYKVKNLFLELASMERGHKSKLEDIYTNMAFPESW